MLIHSLRLCLASGFSLSLFPPSFAWGKTMCLGEKMTLVFLTKCDFVLNLIQFS